MSAKQNPVITETSFRKLNREVTETTTHVERSVWKDIARELWKNKIALVCLIMLGIILIGVIFAPVITPFDPDEVDPLNKLAPPSAEHWFGTDSYGRDYFARALYGGRVSLAVAFGSMIMTSFVGVSIGVIAGYYGGRLDFLIMRFTDIFLALPSMLLMIVLNTFLPPSLITLIMVLSLFSWASVARITRAETMSIKERDYVKASENLGAGPLQIILGHIIPNLFGTVIVSATLGIANAILTESSLSYLGLGVQVPQASWGSMLQNAQAFILNSPLLAVYPGVLILITVLTFNLMGDVLRVALVPKEL